MNLSPLGICVGLVLTLATACGAEVAPAASDSLLVNPPHPAEGAPLGYFFAVSMDDAYVDAEVHAFGAAGRCPVLSAKSSFLLNDQPLTVLFGGSGHWSGAGGNNCGGAYYPAPCTGTSTFSATCDPPRISGGFPRTAFDVTIPLTLTVKVGSQIQQSAAPLNELVWARSELADGTLVLSLAGRLVPDSVTASITRTTPPLGTWTTNAFERVSNLELHLPASSSWSPATIKLETKATTAAGVTLHLTQRFEL